MAYVIFDLDGTVIDSSHRHASKPCGSIDLEHWFDNATPDKIAQDTLLPLADSMKRMFAAGHIIIICTARCFSDADHEFLVNNQLPFHYLLKREGRFVAKHDPDYADSYFGFIGDQRGDAEMKTALLNSLAIDMGYTCVGDMQAIMFDDNLAVIDTMLAERVHCFDATKENRRLAA
jgi:hypothetical protein